MIELTNTRKYLVFATLFGKNLAKKLLFFHVNHLIWTISYGDYSKEKFSLIAKCVFRYAKEDFQFFRFPIHSIQMTPSSIDRSISND